MDDTAGAEIEIRRARLRDREAVVGFTTNTWPDRGDDYLAGVFEEWIDTDGPTQRTFVADREGRAVGICQGTLLSEHEAWAQGMRVDPDVRGAGVGRALTGAVLAWARDRGATVCRNMVFSWNTAGLGQSREMGFDPLCSFRWVYPDVDPDAEPSMDVLEDPDAAWSCFRRSDAADVLAGLGLDETETWALTELTRERLRRLADDDALIAVASDGVGGMSYRVRTVDRETDDGAETVAEYGVCAWTDHETLESLAAAIALDAAVEGADRTRVLIPETPRHVSDAAYARIEIADEQDFVLERDLTRSIPRE